MLSIIPLQSAFQEALVRFTPLPQLVNSIFSVIEANVQPPCILIRMQKATLVASYPTPTYEVSMELSVFAQEDLEDIACHVLSSLPELLQHVQCHGMRLENVCVARYSYEQVDNISKAKFELNLIAVELTGGTHG